MEINRIYIHGNNIYRSTTLQLETDADLYAINQMDSLGRGKEVSELLQHLRAVSPFSRIGIADASHSTSISIGAHIDGEEGPDKTDIYYANLQLQEMVAQRIFAEDMKNSVFPYYILVYMAMYDILDTPSENRSPLVNKAAELYIEGIDYFSDPLGKRGITAPKVDIEIVRPSVKLPPLPVPEV